MELKLHIKTPKGQATSAEKKLRFAILKRVKPKESYINDDDSEIVWLLEVSSKDWIRISNNVAKFQVFLLMFLDNPISKKLIKRELGEEKAKEFSDMLLNQTEIEVIKVWDEDPDGVYPTLWEKIKAKFKRKEEAV